MKWRSPTLLTLGWLVACQGAAVTELPSGSITSTRSAPPNRFALLTRAEEPTRQAELQERGDFFAARARAGGKLELRSHLPRWASDSVHLEVSEHDLAVDFKLRGAARVLGRLDTGRLSFEAAGPAGSDLLISVHDYSVEDYVRFSEPGVTSLRYDIDVSRVAGLRLIANTLELLDGSGIPRLRVSPPYVLDADQTARYAELSVEGCAYDSNPASPRGRAVLGPSSASCTLVVEWDDSGLSYPLLVDPRWSTTATGLAQARLHHTASKVKADPPGIPEEMVCLIGGHEGHQLPIGPIECWVAGVWEVRGTIQARFDHTATSFLSPKVLVVGGSDQDGPLKTSQIYDPITGAVSDGDSMVVPRKLHTATLLDTTDEVVILGGGSALPLFFKNDGSSHAATGSAMQQARFGHVAELAAGKVFVFGGSATPDLKEPLDSVGYFDPSDDTQAFKELSVKMNTARIGHTATHLPAVKSALHPMGEQILVVGGNLVAQLFNPTSYVFTDSGTAASRRRTRHAAVPMPIKNGDALVMLVGGGADPYVWDQNEVYSSARGEWIVPDLRLSEQREAHTATLLDDGHTVVVAGGERSPGVLYSKATDFALLYGPGEPCAVSTDCVSGVCSVNVCCNSECKGGCEACTVAAGADTNGVCKTLEVGADCLSDPLVCHERGTCDGASSVCPPGDASADDSPCMLDGEVAVCQGGSCAAPSTGGEGGQPPDHRQGEGGEPATGGDTGAGGDTPQAGASGAGGEGPEPAIQKPKPEPAIHWSCSATPTPCSRDARWWWASAAISLVLSRRARGARGAR